MVCGEQQAEGIGVRWNGCPRAEQSRAVGDCMRNSRRPAAVLLRARQQMLRKTLEEFGLDKNAGKRGRMGAATGGCISGTGGRQSTGSLSAKAARVGSVPAAYALESRSCCRRQSKKPACAALVYSGWLAGFSALAPTNYPELSIRLGAACLPTSLGAVAGDQRQLGAFIPGSARSGGRRWL